MSKLVLVGAADSIGVPYTRDNKEHCGFYEMIEQELSLKYDLVSLNCFHMAVHNDNDYIKEIISSDVTLADVKSSQNAMLKRCKYSGVYPFLEMPKSFLNHYQLNKDDYNIIVRDAIKHNDTLFIYSAFVNDVLKAMNLSLFKLLMPGRIKRELNNVQLDFVFDKLEYNIRLLRKINKNIKIYIIGLFMPTKLNYIRDNLSMFILSVNKELKRISNKYDNVYFVDNENLMKKDFNNIDFHPNKNGHKKIYENFMKVYE